MSKSSDDSLLASRRCAWLAPRSFSFAFMKRYTYEMYALLLLLFWEILFGKVGPI